MPTTNNLLRIPLVLAWLIMSAQGLLGSVTVNPGLHTSAPHIGEWGSQPAQAHHTGAQASILATPTPSPQLSASRSARVLPTGGKRPSCRTLPQTRKKQPQQHSRGAFKSHSNHSAHTLRPTFVTFLHKRTRPYVSRLTSCIALRHIIR